MLDWSHNVLLLKTRLIYEAVSPSLSCIPVLLYRGTNETQVNSVEREERPIPRVAADALFWGRVLVMLPESATTPAPLTTR